MKLVTNEDAVKDMIVVQDSNQSSPLPPDSKHKNQFAIQIDKLDSETNQYSKDS